MKVDAFLMRHPVFRLQEFAEAQGKDGDLDAARNQVKYHIRQGRIKRVAAGVYAAVPDAREPEAFWPDPVLVAACLRPGGIFSHHTALELMGAGHSVWQVCTLFCADPPPLELGEQRIQFLAFPKILVAKDQTVLGAAKREIKGRWIAHTGPERTLV